MFRATSNKGFQMTFENGWTISVQWGPGNYCENRSFDPATIAKSFTNPVVEQSSPNAEIAIWDNNGVWYDFGSDTVLGWQTPEDVVYWILVTKGRERQPILTAVGQADGATT